MAQYQGRIRDNLKIFNEESPNDRFFIKKKYFWRDIKGYYLYYKV